MKTFLTRGVRRYTFLISGSVIKSNDPRQCFTLDPFRPVSRNALYRNACMSISFLFSTKLALFSSYCNQLPEHKCTITLCWKEFNLQLETTANVRYRTKLRHTNQKLQNIIL